MSLIAAERHGRILVLRFDRPEKRNAVNDALMTDLEALVSGQGEDAGAIVLHGAGGHFCAGLDLAEHAMRDAFGVVQHSQFWHRVLDRVQFGGRPVIAALKGGVIGGGLEIAMAAHIRVAEPSTFYQLPEGRRGIFVGGGASVRVRQVIGAGRMVEMMLTGRAYDAAEGQALGLSHYLVGEGEALAKAMALAETVAQNAPISNYMILNALPRIADMPQADGLFTESLAAALSQTSDDARKGIEAFLAKRKAEFGKKR